MGHVDVGNITALTYSNAYSIFDVTRSDFNSYNQTSQTSSPIYLANDTQYNQLIRAGLLFNWAFRFSPEHIIEFKNLYNQSSADQYVDRTGANFESGVLLDNGAFDKTYRGIYSGQLLGTHKVNKEQTVIEWVAGYNNSYRDQPDYKRYRTDIDGATGSATLFVPVGAASPDFLGRFYSNLDETSLSGAVSVKQRFERKRNPVLSPEVKAGAFFERKDREFAARNIGFIRASSSNFNTGLLQGTIGELFSPQNINNTTGIRIDEQSNPNDNYTASNLLVAYYGTVTLPLSRTISLDAGVRVEDNTQEMHSALFTGEAVDVEYPVTSVLPSATLTYNINAKMMLKAAYGKTVNRPEFRELAPFGFYDFNFNFTNKGNPNLRTATIQNFDLRWELYPTKAETVSFGVFYKDFSSPIETVFNPGSGSLGAKSFTYQNASRAFNYGIEAEVRKSLAGLSSSDVLNNLSVLFNMALIRSEIELGHDISAGQSNKRPLQGQAPYVVNAGLFYDEETSGLQVNLLYNVVGRSIVFVGFADYPDLYLMPRNVLDLTFSKRIGERWQIKGGVSDILNQDMLILQDGNLDGDFDRDGDQVIQSFKPGQLFSLGFSVRL
jgi:outer membrane cobalamin receptor